MSAGQRLRGVFAMRPGLARALFDADASIRLHQLIDIDPDVAWSDADGGQPPADAEVLITGWGAPSIDAAVLQKMPRLRSIFHTGGSVRGFVDDELWRRGIRITTAAEANAIAVAQFSTALIVLALKDALVTAHRYATSTTGREMPDEVEAPGVWGSTVGIVGASRTGRRTIELLRGYGCRILVTDPYLADHTARGLGAIRVGLEELFEAADVVSIHAPDLPETRGMIDGGLLARLRDGATLINTARPALIDHPALLAELRTGRISAMLDVTDPEPLPAGDELLQLPNVFVTPHLAGAHGRELTRLGESVLAEIERFVADEAALDPVRREEIVLRA